MNAPLRVKLRPPSKNIGVQVKNPPTINATIRKIFLSNVNLEKLKNVDTTPFGLDTGFTVVYDLSSQTWITQPLPAGLTGDIDGGLY